MEALRDLALADYENLPDDVKEGLRAFFNEMVADGKDFSEYFKNYSSDSPPRFPDTCEIHKKTSLDFEEFITLTYIYDRGETVLILCKGCSSLISGRPYFICNDCFNDGRSFYLCCECYRCKNFKDHQHRNFSSNLSTLFGCRFGAAVQKNELKKRNDFIDRALSEFGKEFMEFARSVATYTFKWDYGIGLSDELDEMSHRMKESPREILDAKEEEDNSTISRPQGSRNRYIDLLGLKATDVISLE